MVLESKDEDITFLDKLVNVTSALVLLCSINNTTGFCILFMKYILS